MKSLSVVSPSPSSIVGLDDRERVSPASSLSSSVSFDSRSSSLRETVDGNRIRSRFLNKLGITQQPGPSGKRPPVVRKIAPISAPLKYDDTATEDATDCESLSSSSRKSVVAFDNEVSVVPIPKHHEYSDRIRKSLWLDKQAMRIMVRRNTLEYQAEGWNPSTVVEDEGFITTASGERIHPVHLQRLLCSPFFRRGL